MNKLFVGFSKQIDLPNSNFLLIDDDIPSISQRHRIFDPLVDSFNPLKDIDYKRARELVDVLYTTTPQGENTLTVRNGKRSLLKAILNAKYFDQVKGDDEVDAMITDLLLSPVLSRVLCSREKAFSFNPRSVVLAKLDRKVIGDFDALVLGLLLINQFKGQVVIPEFGFYGRDAHIGLIREQRLIAGVNFLGELSPRLTNAVLLIKDKEASGALYYDAKLLAEYAGLMPDPDHTLNGNPYNDFIKAAMD